MKKILKKLTALMLSLVMIFGCIPSFINEVSAEPEPEPSEWRKLNSAMSEDGVETVGGVFTIENDEGTHTRTIVLQKDITATSEDKALNVKNTTTKIILDLNGHILNRGLISANGTETYNEHGSVIEIVGGDLEIRDSKPNEEHVGYITTGGLWHLNATGEEKIIKGGVITGGTGTKNGSIFEGGGVFIDAIGKLTLTAGTIAGNIAYGGGVRIKNNSYFTMNGGAISYNKNNNSAAGVLCENSTYFTMNDGEISYNTANGDDGVGGIRNSGTTTIKGGKIIYNKSAGYAGGVFNSTKYLTISGNPIIKDNINTRKQDDISWPQNLLTPNGYPITIGELNNAEIYITGYGTYSGHGTAVLTSGFTTSNPGAGIEDFFHYDGPDKFYMQLVEGELKVVSVPEEMKINIVSEHGTVSTNLLHSYADLGTEVTLTVTPDSYYELETLEVKDSDDAPIELVNNTFTKGEKAVTITATYKELPRPTGSKKYKANDTKDTTEKISGSGKKGSTRTITPQEGRKVTSVVVTDKDGNKIDVTLNEDGTYSFVQPASNVDVQVNYKNREITLNIGSTEASVDDEKTNLDVAPVIRNDRTMLPIRFVAENLGAKVEWNELEPNMVYITRGDIKIEIKLGSNIAKVNGKEYELDSVAFAENDRTYLPVRFVSEALNAIVEWNESKPNEVKIYEQ